MNVTEKSHAVERVEHVLLLASCRDAVLEKEPFDVLARQHVARKHAKEALDFELTDERRNLGQVLLRDLGGGLVNGFLEAELIAPLLGPQRRQTLTDGHQVPRP